MPLTQVTTVGVVGLTTASQYADSFVVQICSDAAYATLLQTGTSLAVWDGAAWDQVSAIFFDGMNLGQTYYLRCAVRAPVSGKLSAWANWSVVAGATPIPACTFGGSYTGTLSGVSYLIAAGNVPADIDHFEAWWSTDGTSPLAVAHPTKGNIAPDFNFPVFTPGVPGQSVTLFLRGVNTSQQAQSWVATGGAVPVMATVNAAGQISSTAIVSGKSQILGDISDLANGTIGFNSIPNAHFTKLANAGSNDVVFLGWRATGQSPMQVTQYFGVEFSGSPVLKLSTAPGYVLPVGLSQHAYSTSTPIPVVTGDKFYLQAEVYVGQDFALPSGVTAATSFGVQTTYADGTLGYQYITPQLTTVGGWQSIHGVLSITPQGAALPSSIVVWIFTGINNTNAASLTLPNGSIWSVLVDHVVLTKALSLTDEQIGKNGSIPISYTQSMSYNSSDTTITWNWSITIYRTDNNSSITATTGSNTVAGLTASTVYYFYPFYDETAQQVRFVLGGAGSDGSAQPSTGVVLTQAQARCDRVPLSQAPVTAATGVAATPPPAPSSGQFTFQFLPSGSSFYLNNVVINTPGTNHIANSTYNAIFIGATGDTNATGQFLTDANGGLVSFSSFTTGSFSSSSVSITVQMSRVSSGGSGGGSGTCLHSSMLVEEKDLGEIPCRDLRVGHSIRGPRGWLPVTDTCTRPNDLWVRITTNCGQTLLTTPGHTFTLLDSTSVEAAKLALNDMLPTVLGASHPTSLSLYQVAGECVRITLHNKASDDTWDHVFYTGDTIACVGTHNSPILSC